MTGPRPTSDATARDPGKPSLKPEAIIKWLVVAVVVLVLIIGVLLALGSSGSTESDSADPGTAQSTAPSPPPTSSSTARAEYVMDAKGWQDTEARCEAPSRPLETARTADALVVICFTPGGELAYKGVRTSDGDSIVIDEVEVTSWSYSARNEGVHYGVTNTELTISSGDSIIYQSPFIERRGNSLSDERPTAPAATTTTSRQPSQGGRESFPPLPGSEAEGQDRGNGSAAEDGYGMYESYGEYNLHFQCTVWKMPTTPCFEIIEKYGPEAESQFGN